MAETAIRQLITIFGFDVDEATLNRFDRQVDSIKKNLRRAAIVGGIAAGAFIAIARATARAGDNVAKTARRFGVGIQTLQEWRFIAERSGISTELLDTAIQMLGKNANDTANNIGEAKDSFRDLGVEVTDSEGRLRKLDDILADTIDKLAQEESHVKRLGIATRVFGRGGGPIVQMLGGGVEALDALRKRFRQLDGAIDDTTAKLSEEAVDAWTDLKVATNGVIFAMGKELLPTMTDAINALAEFIADNKEWIKTITLVILGFLSLTAAIFATKAVVVGLQLAWGLLNKTLSLTILKVIALKLLVFGLLILFYIIVDDVAAYIRGGDSVIGRLGKALLKAINKAKAAILRTIDSVWAYLMGKWETFKAAVLAFPGQLKKEIKDSLGVLAKMAGPQWQQPSAGTLEANKILRAQMTQANLAPQRIGGAPVTNNITINTLPGQTPETIGLAAAAALSKAAIASSTQRLGK